MTTPARKPFTAGEVAATLTGTQRQHAVRRVAGIVEKHKRAVAAVEPSKYADDLWTALRLAEIRSGRAVLDKAKVRAARSAEALTKFYTYPKLMSREDLDRTIAADRAACSAARDQIDVDATTLLDEVILGDGATALRLLREFEARDYAPRNLKTPAKPKAPPSQGGDDE